MELIYSVRDDLITMTIIENWWRETAKNEDLFERFFEVEFHGLTETIK